MYREGNKCVDMLAKEGCCLNDEFIVLENPLSNELCILLEANIAGI